MKNLLPVVFKDNILNKLKKFMYKFVNKKDSNLNIYQEEHKKDKIKTNSFIEEIQIDKEYSELLELKRKLKNKLISPFELTEQQIDKLQSLFDEDIRNKRKKIANLF